MTAQGNLTRERLWQIEQSLSPRDQLITETVARLGLVSGDQLRQLFFVPGTSKDDGRRSAQLSLSRLERCDLLVRLARRIGGVRSGSSGYVYGLGVAGQRLARQWFSQPDGRSRKLAEPSEPFVAHQLACAQLYVDLKKTERYGELRLSTYLGEPDCWRKRIGPFGKALVLKPDAFVKVATDGRELHWFIEVDLATESQTVIARKGWAYQDHYRSGVEADVMPRVLWLAPSQRRADQLASTLNTLGESAEKLHLITTREQAIHILKGEIS